MNRCRITFGANSGAMCVLQRARINAGVSQRRGAQVLGITANDLNDIEHHRKDISPQQRIALLAFYDAAKSGKIDA